MAPLPIHLVLALALALTTILGSADVASCSIRGRRLGSSTHHKKKHGKDTETSDVDFIYPRNTAGTITCLTTPQPIITYHSPGSLMTSSQLNIYLLLVGIFSTQQSSYITNFVSSLGNSSTGNIGNGTVYNWWSINMKYYDSKRKNVTRAITLAATASISTAGLPTTLTSTAIGNIVSNYITSSQRRVADTNGIYVVLTSGAYTQQYLASDGSSLGSSCINFCGWHSNLPYPTSSSSSLVKFAWTGIPTQCPTSCGNSIPSSYLPTGVDAATYSAVSILAHEIAEATTDALGSAWYDSRGCENGDKCNFLYKPGSKYVPAGYYNLQGLNSFKYLIQMNWDPVLQTCAAWST